MRRKYGFNCDFVHSCLQELGRITESTTEDGFINLLDESLRRRHIKILHFL
jgi:hypothetical protein